jgi:hypothetical protein
LFVFATLPLLLAVKYLIIYICIQHVLSFCKAVFKSGWGYLKHSRRCGKADIVNSSNINVDSIICDYPIEYRLPNVDTFTSLAFKLQAEKRVPCTTIDLLFSFVRQTMLAMQNFSDNECKDYIKSLTASLTTLSSSQMRDNFFAELFPMLPTMCTTFDTGGSCYYLRVFDLLGFLMNFTQVTDSIFATPDDVCNSVYARSVNAGNRPMIYMSLYGDEIEVCNPIGKHRGKHKLFTFYIQLLNIPALLRSKPNSIFPLAVAKSKDINANPSENLRIILKDFIDSVNILSTTGYNFNINNESVSFNGALLYCLGDSLFLNFIGGFKCSFGPNVVRMCRTCNITPAQMKDIYGHNQDRLRSKEGHNNRLLDLYPNCSFGAPNATDHARVVWHDVVGL